MNIYSRIFNYIRPYRLIVLLSLIASFFYACLNTFSFWMISSLITTIMQPDGKKELIKQTTLSINEKLENITYSLIGNESKIEQLEMLCIILIITYLLKNLFGIINNVCMIFVGSKLIMNLRNQLFSHLQKLPISFYNKNKSGELSSITMNDVTNIRVTLSESIQNLINEPLSIIIMLFMLFIINVKMTIYILLAIPIAAFVISKLGHSIRRKAMRSSLQIADIMNIFQETISGIRIVKAFVMEKFEIKRFHKENYKFFKLIFLQENMQKLLTPISDMIGVSLGVLLLWIGGREVILYGNIDSDDFIRYIIYLFAMLQPARKLGGVNAQIQSGVASAQRVFSILDVKPDIKESSKPKNIKNFNNKIEFQNVSFKYDNSENPSLYNINLNIPKGSTLALVGSSGAGKSTFVDLIPRFYDVSSGAILIDGFDIRKITLADLRRMMGIVSQETILFNETIFSNICYGQPNTDIQKVRLAAEAANALEFIENLPNGFDTYIGEKGTRLSGGQKQRLSIARAILKNPEILILDEATSSLDTESERKVQLAIDNLVKNRTVIVIAHRLSTITNADKIIVLDDGNLIEFGTHKELLEIGNKYKTLYDIQYGEKP